MDSLSERISAVIESLGMKKTAFAERLNVSQAFISQLCSGTKQPSDRTIAYICREFHVSEHWLRTGEGSMFIEISPDDEIDIALEQIVQRQGEMSDITKGIIRAYWKLGDKEKDLVDKMLASVLEELKTKDPGNDRGQ